MIRILVVDDDRVLNQTVCTYLNDCGFEAKGVLGAKEAYDEMSDYSSQQAVEVLTDDILQ